MEGLLLLLAILLPAAGSVMVMTMPWLNARREDRNAFVGVVMLLECLVVGLIALDAERTLLLFEMTRQLPIALHSDGTSRVFSVVMALMWTISGFYSFSYMRHEVNERTYYAFYLMTLASLMALTLSATMVTMYLFFEMMTFISMPMVLHSRSKGAVAAGIKYLIYSVAGATMGLLGIFILTPQISNHFFTAGGSLAVNNLPISMEALRAVVFITLVGFGTKAGMFPMHGWLPTAHPVAPSPASAVLSGVITKAGVLCIFRMIFYVIGPDFIRGTWVQWALLGCATITVFMGSMLALREKVLKKRLAYSSVSQVSYVLCGLFMLNTMALDGALLQLVFHALTKDALFLCAGVIIFKTGLTRVEDMQGLGRRMPLTMTMFLLCAISLVGIPPLGGFIAKWYIAEGSLVSGVQIFSWLVPIVLLISAMLTAGYLLPPSVSAFFGGLGDGEAVAVLPKAEPGPMMLVPIAILTLAILLLGIYPGSMIHAFSSLAGSLL
ncbi:MAG TPA: proton-conducting transporter membrane subunit [Candidatus Limnocylindria bacterium]|nr:proton-conducting transporter membrane subunit [Candidatus Limnocylindria bacterium]